MIYSQVHALIPTLKEAPQDAETRSHILMMRAGLIRKLSSGLYTYLPLCLKVIRKIETIIREEMDAVGAQELLMPFLQPRDVWEKSGRWYAMGAELMRLKNRQDRDFILGPTHEEVITDLVSREVHSYRQLPCHYYQIQCKVRDEIRPRFGVVRAKEFIMKDAYSFHANEASLHETFCEMGNVYRRVFSRCALAVEAVDADAGMMGGSVSTEFMALAPSGEDKIMRCNACDYAANLEKAEGRRPPVVALDTLQEKKKVATPNQRTIEEVSAYLSVTPERMIKALFYQDDKDNRVCVLVCGNDSVNEVKLCNYLQATEIVLIPADRTEDLTAIPVGFVGPIDMPSDIRMLADTRVMAVQDVVCGANEKDVHWAHVQPGRDFSVGEVVDIIAAKEGERCPVCDDGTLYMEYGIELGHIFKLGHKYSVAMGASFLDETGQQQTFTMGCYGIGVSRMVAAVVEQHNDEDGIIWPVAVAPMDICVIAIHTKSEHVMHLSHRLYESLRQAGFSVLLDDRPERPGIKFKDADLVGLPLQVRVGERRLTEGNIEVNVRRTGEVHVVPVSKALKHIQDIYDAVSRQEQQVQ